MKKKTLAMAIWVVLSFLIATLRIPMSVYTEGTVIYTLDPDGNGAIIEWSPSFFGINWQRVSKLRQPEPDGDNTYVYAHGFDVFTDTYTLNNPIPQGSQIHKVTVYARARDEATLDWEFELLAITHGLAYIASPTYTLDPVYFTYPGYILSVNPYTLKNWTWNEINELEVGIRGYHELGYLSSDAKVTWVYVEVEATPVGVGGIVVPVDKLALLTPYIGLASTILVAAVATGVYVKRVKQKKERQ